MIHYLEIIEIKQNIYMTKQQINIKERWITFKRIISIITNFFILLKMAKKSLVVYVQKLLFEKYMKSHKIYIYIYILTKQKRRK